MSEKYTIDNVKNDIQNLQSQNLFDFQEIKRLERELKKVNDELHLHLKIYNIKQLNDNNQFDLIKEEYNNLFNIIDNTIYDITMLQTDINTIKGNNNIYQTDLTTLRTNINQLENNLRNINTMLSNLESIDTNINSRLNQVINTALPNITSNINNLNHLTNVNIQDISDLENRVTDLENNQDNTVATNLLSSVENLRIRLNVAENEVTNNKNKITDILTNITTIQNTLNSFDTRLIDVEDIVLGNLPTRLHVYEVNLQRFDEELNQAQIDIELLYHLIEQGGAQGGTGTGVTPELLQRLDDIEQSIINTNTRIDNLQLTNIEQDVQTIRDSVTALQEQTNNLADDVEELANKVLNMDLSIMDDRITANENNITDLGTRVFNLETDNIQNKQGITDINNRLDNLDIPDTTDIENRVTTNETNITGLQEQIDNLDIPDITDIENRVTTNETNITGLQEQIDNLDIPDITDIENRVTTNETNITDLQEQIDNLDIPENVDLTDINDKITQLENKANFIPVVADNPTDYDLNNYKENGNYSIGIPANYKNIPETSSGLLTVTRSNTFRVQIYTVINNNNVYFRKSIDWGKSWSSWLLLNDSADLTDINTKLAQLENKINNLPEGGTGGTAPDGTTLEDLVTHNNYVLNYVNGIQGIKIYEKYERITISSSLSTGNSIGGKFALPTGVKILYATLYTGSNSSKSLNYSKDSYGYFTFTAKESIGTGTYYLYVKFVV